MPTDAQTQIKELEAKIQQLRSVQVTELKEKLHAARQVVSELESQIAKMTGKPAGPAAGARRTRTSTDEIRGRILKTLAGAPTGLSQKGISEATGLNYNTVVIFLKKNAREFKTTGALKSKRYFLK